MDGPSTAVFSLAGGDGTLRAMKIARSPSRHLVWTLLALILFHGFACSLGHGLMLGGMGAGQGGSDHLMNMRSMSMDSINVHSLATHSMDMPSMDMPTMPLHMDGAVADDPMGTATTAEQQSAPAKGTAMPMQADCAFAGTLMLALVFFIALGWLSHGRRPQPRFARALSGLLARDAFPRLNPQAP